MKEAVDQAFISASGKVEFFDIQGIDHEYRAKIKLPMMTVTVILSQADFNAVSCLAV